MQRWGQRISRRAAEELTDIGGLLAHADAAACDAFGSNDLLLARCDLAKAPDGTGICGYCPAVACHLRRHTEVLRRYGHFGKVPTSIALVVREAAARDLEDLYRAIVARNRRRLDRALELEGPLSRAWRINAKISAMFLSLSPIEATKRRLKLVWPASASSMAVPAGTLLGVVPRRYSQRWSTLTVPSSETLCDTNACAPRSRPTIG